MLWPLSNIHGTQKQRLWSCDHTTPSKDSGDLGGGVTPTVVTSIVFRYKKKKNDI